MCTGESSAEHLQMQIKSCTITDDDARMLLINISCYIYILAKTKLLYSCMEKEEDKNNKLDMTQLIF